MGILSREIAIVTGATRSQGIASKGILIAITEPLSVGLAPIGITVNSIDPGPTDSGWMNKSINDSLSYLFLLAVLDKRMMLQD